MTTNWKANRTAPRRETYSDKKVDRIIGDRLLRKLERELVWFQLTGDERDFTFQNCRVDDNLDPLPLPPETVKKIGNNREAIRQALIRRERILEKFTAVWWHWDNGYREYCREYWARQDR